MWERVVKSRRESETDLGHTVVADGASEVSTFPSLVVMFSEIREELMSATVGYILAVLHHPV